MPAARTPIEQRRGSKPLVEKKRRARINQSLAELQALVVDTKKKRGNKQSRVEKADILEMTVRHLQAAQKQQTEKHSHARNDRFESGYMECVEEVHRFLANSKSKNSAALGERLTSHLMLRFPRVQPATPTNDDKDDQQQHERPTPNDTPPSSSSEEDSMETILRRRDLSPATSGKSSSCASELSIVPSCLPNGQLAYVVPDKDYPFWNVSNNCKPLLVSPTTHLAHDHHHHHQHSSKDFEDGGRLLCLAAPVHRSKVIYFNGPIDLSRVDSGTMWRPW